MAEGAVRFALGKLANIIMKEMEFLGGVREKVERLHRELTRIRCCLIDADSRRKGDERVQNWLNELRDVAYRIEDAIDTFFLEYDDDNYHKNPSILQKVVKKLRSKLPKMYILDNLGTELNKIQNQLDEISRSRDHYGIIALQDIVGEADIMHVRRATYQVVDETEVVGLQADKNNILKLLRPKETRRRAVITIVGTGGLGKTTLAHMVYISAKADFDYHIMLSISQTFRLTDLLRKMILKLKDSVPENQDVGDLINELNFLLSTRRYLIILDDVWQVDLWIQLKNALPDNKNGSRILMTSRFIDVGKSAEPIMAPYELSLLDDRRSLDLLLKKALPYQEPNEEFPSDLLELADELSNKCKGLPLALIVLGGILSTKERDYHVWERVLRTMDWHSDGKDCMDVLAMSYQDMPYYLKACFLYLACFPEDDKIPAKRLIRMWIAEGFIPQEGRKTLEETAENCLEELFQRSMVQVSSRYPNGSIKICKVHDLLRDLAMHEAEQENFVTVFSPEYDVNQPNRGTRRVSLQYSMFPITSQQHSTPKEYVGLNTRAIHIFKFEEYLGLNTSNFSNFRLLKVLVIESWGNDYDSEVSGLDELVHLKYLCLTNCAIPNCSFHRMKALETIEIEGTDAQTFRSDTLWTIGTLRHALIGNGIIDGPPSTADLRNLQTLQNVWSMKAWEMKVPILNNLRKLHLSKAPCSDWVAVTNLLQVLPYLVHLKISCPPWITIPIEIAYPKILPNYQNLQSLSLEGKWSETDTLEASSFPPHLVGLKLIDTQFKQNPMPELGKLKSLKKLSLEGMYFNYHSPTICSAGFPVLQYLKVDHLEDTNDFMVAEGVMPKLTYVKLCNKVKLQLPPELQHVTINQPL